MNCLHIRNGLMDYFDEKTDQDLRLEIEGHLATCKACRDYSFTLREAFQMISLEKNIEYDPFMFTRLQASVIDQKNIRRTPLLNRLLQPALIATFVLFLVYAGISIGSDYNYQQSIITDYETELYYLNDIQNESYESIMLFE